MSSALATPRAPRIKRASVNEVEDRSFRFELADAPPAFRPILWEAEFSERGIRRLSLLSVLPRGAKISNNGQSAHDGRRLKELKRALLSRFKGGRADFAWEDFDLGDAGPFHLRVWKAMREIPFGETASYADVARDAGSPLAFRACGQACGANRIVVFIPCHRVVGSSGLGGFGCGLEWKKKFLAMEGWK